MLQREIGMNLSTELGFFFFRNQREERWVGSPTNFVFLPRPVEHPSQIYLNDVPRSLVKVDCELIGPQRPVQLQSPNCITYLMLQNWLHKFLILIIKNFRGDNQKKLSLRDWICLISICVDISKMLNNMPLDCLILFNCISIAIIQLSNSIRD